LYYGVYYYYFYHRRWHSTNDTILPLDHAMVTNPNHVYRYPEIDGARVPNSAPLMDIIANPTDILKLIGGSDLDGSIEYSLIHYFLILVGFKRALEIVKVQ